MGRRQASMRATADFVEHMCTQQPAPANACRVLQTRPGRTRGCIERRWAEPMSEVGSCFRRALSATNVRNAVLATAQPSGGRCAASPIDVLSARVAPNCTACTVAILAQGTSWAVAVTQAFLQVEPFGAPFARDLRGHRAAFSARTARPDGSAWHMAAAMTSRYRGCAEQLCAGALPAAHH